MNEPAATKVPTVAIIGAGISGLASAHHLNRIAQAHQRRVVLHLLESDTRAGGVIRSESAGGCTCEFGPDSILAEKPRGRAFCEEIGLEPRLISTEPANRGTSIAKGDRLVPIPKGLNLFAPSRILPMLRSPLLSTGGKLRMLCEPFIRRRRNVTDESLASFVRRRFGDEVLHNLAQPLAGGIYTADPERLSMDATMARFVEMERKHGSVTAAMLRRRAQGDDDNASATGPRHNLFFAFRDGIEELPKRLEELLPPGVLKKNTCVSALVATPSGWQVRTNDIELSVDAVCLALPAYLTADLVAPVDRDLHTALREIRYASAATINIVLDRSEVPRPLAGYGFVVPARERRTTIACTYSSHKYAHRAPDGSVLLRAFVGGALAPDKLTLDDANLTNAVMADLRDLLGITARPREVIITRWPESMPQYDVGHLQRVAKIAALLEKQPGLYVAGNAYDGVGIPDCIRSGEMAAEAICKLIFPDVLKPRSESPA